jgi:hypothetical protein
LFLLGVILDNDNRIFLSTKKDGSKRSKHL